MLAFEMKDKIDGIIVKYGKKQSAIITILQEVQKIIGYLPEEALEYIANIIDISPSKIFGVATFYENFSLEPKGKHIIKICDGTACHIRKSIPILNALREELSLNENKNTTDDLLFTIELVSCLGACSLAPALNIDGRVYGNMTPKMTIELLNRIKEDNSIEN